MRYISTRDENCYKNSAEAIAKGLAADGGLFTPEKLPVLSEADFLKLTEMDYSARAAYILSLFLPDFTHTELLEYAKSAYENGKFENDIPAPLREVSPDTEFLELWHGPTCAFKDMALQMLPYLLTASLTKTGENREVCILVATSGDTGSAALSGFSDVKGTKILVFYPKNGVSETQELQMTTMDGGNIGVCAVNGNFDDTQTGVKSIFSDRDFADKLSRHGYFLSSANSINWGRVAPQIVYYISAYCELISKKTVKFGDKINFCVPTGNFGNILSAYYAGKMGLPLGKLICASNSNNVLTDFLKTGKYNAKRKFFTTISPSMDILISSNLERMLFELCGHNGSQIREYMENLRIHGEYEVSTEIKEKLSEIFCSGYVDDLKTKEIIGELYNKTGYLTDPHTAVAYGVLEAYRTETGDNTPTVIVSTASPFKFSASVLEALGENNIPNGIAQLSCLAKKTRRPIPVPLAKIDGKTVRFSGTAKREDMLLKVKEMLDV